VLSLNQLAIRRGGRLLFSDATFTIHAGERAGITGANGCGKSSLFQLILREIEADDGSWSVAGNPEIAHVAQELECNNRNAIEHVLDGDVEYRRLLDQLDHPSGHAQQRFEEIDGYGAPARAAQLLAGLGFTEDRVQSAANTLSGGWRMRISLARALMCRSDLLLLDEPTNHLDLDAVIWLEQWLVNYQGTLLLISHDREFLDRIATQIVAMEHGRVTINKGDYSNYESVRAMRLGQQHAAHQKQQRDIQHMQSFVTRFRAKATKARQAQSRLKALERMELIAPAHVDSPFNFAFQTPEHLPDPILRLDGVSVGYGETTILQNIKLSVTPGDRIGLLGLNGAGKSTLSKMLAAEIVASSGIYTTAKHFKCGYFAQEQLELLVANETPADHFKRIYKLHDEQRLRNFLGGFGFSGDRVFEPVAPFSGGEKARLVLAIVVYARPNLLILDEPTNHLDIDMRHALTVALQSFEGALILVSHDRHLLRATSDQLLLVDDGVVVPFDADLDDYPKWLADRRRRRSSIQSNNNPKRDNRRYEADIRQQLKPMRKRITALEKSLGGKQTENNRLQERLADSSIYQASAKQQLKELLSEQAAMQQSIDNIENELLETMEQLELAETELRAIG
jgi:ATP-binding cassette, subfamily F, member 3